MATGLGLKILPIDEATKSLDPEAQKRVIDTAMTESALAIKVDYGVTVQTWKSKPKFVIEKVKFGETLIYTEDEIYGYVSEGTEAHWVEPVNKAALAFPANYKAKTVPGSISSRQGGPFGDTVFSKGHMVGGIKARDFPAVIHKKWDKQWPIQLQRALNSYTI